MSDNGDISSSSGFSSTSTMRSECELGVSKAGIPRSVFSNLVRPTIPSLDKVKGH